MMKYPYPYPWKELSGTSEEMVFLDRRFIEMSVREQYLVEGASQLQSISTAADLINLTEQLECFSLYFGVKNDADIGRYIATHQHQATESQLLYVDLNRWGLNIREQNSGVFVSGGYVEQHYSCHEVYTAKIWSK